MDDAPRPPPLPHPAARQVTVRRGRGAPRAWHTALAALLVGAFCVGGFFALRRLARGPGADAPRVDGGLDAGTLESLVRARADVVRVDGRPWWTDCRGRQFVIVWIGGAEGIAIETPGGPLDVSVPAFAHWTLGPPPNLEALLARAAAAGFLPAELTLDHDRLVGPHLGSMRAIVLEDAVLERRDVPVARDAPLRDLKAEVERFVAALEEDPPAGGAMPLDEAARRAVAEVLRGLSETGGREWFGSLQPEVTRRLVRHGWLDNLPAAPEARDRLRSAVEAACRLRPARRFAGPGAELVWLEDAFGRDVRAWRAPGGSGLLRYEIPQPDPQWLAAPDLTAVVEVRALDVETMQAAVIDPVAAEVYRGNVRLARWRAGEPLVLDGGPGGTQSAWAQRVQGGMRGRDDLVEGAFPAHIVLANPLGDVYALVTPYGTLHPARDGSKAETDRFLEEAAAALPTAAYLDLLGEVLYAYAWDTTAYDRPLLVGTKEHNGDIHQTLPQTLATCAGGCYRGDCDDLACFFHTLARHQGRNAHVMKLPWHLACAWAERLDDGSWTTYVLHTGPPLQFHGRTLDDALRATYGSFESMESIDLQSLPFALRFGEDAVRETYNLPGEIFADREYAQLLIAVQAAYRDHTYLSGVDTMRAVLALREAPSSADHREIAHLLTWAGRHEEATAAFEASLAKAAHPEARVDAAGDLLLNLVRRGDAARITSLADDLERRWIPEMERAEGHKLVGPWLRLAGVLLQCGDRALRMRGLSFVAHQAWGRAKESFARIRTLAQRDEFDPQWLHYSGLPRHEQNVNGVVRGAIAALAATRKDEGDDVHHLRRILSSVLESWFRDVAFRTIHTHESRLARHGLLAAWYASESDPDTLYAAVQAAGLPTEDDLLRLVPARLVPQDPDGRTLRLFDVTPEAHRDVWWRALAAKDERYDPERAREALRAEALAFDAAQALGHGHWSHGPGRLLVAVGRALVAQDPEAFRAALKRVAAVRNHDLRASVTSLMALAALRLPLDAFSTWLGIWAEELDDDEAHGFEIAWAAMHAERPQHALLAARLTHARHPEHASFASELAHMEALATGR